MRRTRHAIPLEQSPSVDTSSSRPLLWLAPPCRSPLSLSPCRSPPSLSPVAPPLSLPPVAAPCRHLRIAAPLFAPDAHGAGPFRYRTLPAPHAPPLWTHAPMGHGQPATPRTTAHATTGTAGTATRSSRAATGRVRQARGACAPTRSGPRLRRDPFTRFPKTPTIGYGNRPTMTHSSVRARGRRASTRRNQRR